MVGLLGGSRGLALVTVLALLASASVAAAGSEPVAVEPDGDAKAEYVAVSGTGNASSDGLAVAFDGQTNGLVAVSGFGEATGDAFAAAVGDDASCEEGSCIVVSGTGDAESGRARLAASGTGDAACSWGPCIVISGIGDAEDSSAIVAVSGTGDTYCAWPFLCLAVSGTGDAVCAVSGLPTVGCVPLSGTGTADCNSLEAFCFETGGCNVIELAGQTCPEPVVLVRSRSPVTVCPSSPGSDASSTVSVETIGLHGGVGDQEVHVDEKEVSMQTNHDAPAIECTRYDLDREPIEQPAPSP